VVGVPRKRIHCVFKGNMAFQEKYDREPNPKNIGEVTFIQKYANELVRKHDFLPEYSTDDVVKIIDRHDPAIITINAVISALQSHEVIKILHSQKEHDGLGEPIASYIVFNAMTMMFYHIEKNRNPECSQCGSKVRRVTIKLRAKSPTINIINILQENGYELDPELEPVITLSDFNEVQFVDLDQSPRENRLRNCELLTVVGFKGGEIFINLKIV
jgi:hypothetical protein